MSPCNGGIMRKDCGFGKNSLTIKGQGISENKKKKFYSFWERIKGASIVYRGVDGNYLRRIYNADASNIPLLSELLFLYGEKGKAFCDEMKFDNDINNSERICFESILNNMQKSFLDSTSNNCSVNNRMPTFLQENQAVIEDILSCNANDWCKKIDALPQIIKSTIKDYYMSFLHTIGKSGYGNYSYFLSTTKEESVAEYFRNNDEKNGAIIVGWSNGKGIKCSNSLGLRDVVSKYGFPTFKTPFYPKQNEITYKCGLLPHFIVGFHYHDGFEINPYILKINDMAKVRKEGLPVDQTDFIKKLSKTNYKSYYDVCDCFYWQQSV